MADTRAQAYAAQLDALTKMADALTPEARRRILALLGDLNREILADLATSTPASYTGARLRMLKAEVERATQRFADQASADVQKLEASTFQRTAVQIDTTVAAAAGGVMVHPVIDDAALRVVQGYTADLITGLSRDTSAKINAAIQRAYLGGLSLPQLAEQIGRTLEGGSFSGLFSQIGERAMTIATNEIMRVQSLASIARINDLATRHAGLGKMWKHIPVARVPRPSHIIADGQIRKPGEAFLVEGEALQYPRDPAGRAENTINCHCLVVPYVPEEYLKPTDADRALLRSYGLSVQAA